MNLAPLQKESAAEAAQSPQGLGPTLKALREARQLSLPAVSGRLKYTVRQLEALEAGRWEALPSGVPLRGLVKNYGRLLEADNASLMTMLEAETGASAAGPAPLGAGGLASPAMMQADAGPRSSWGWLLVILILLVIAGFYAVERGWVPDSWLLFDWLKALKK